MRTYHVLTAMVRGSLKTGLIDKDDFKESIAADYFVDGATEIEDHGTVDISGPAENMIPDWLIEEQT
jgi:hypothetical protein